MKDTKKIYKPIYDEMRERNENLILAQGTKCDPQLASKEIDTRIGLAVFSDSVFDISPQFNEMLQAATQTFPTELIYQTTLDSTKNHGLLHFTFMQIVGVGPLIKKISTGMIEDYIEVLHSVLSTLPSFSIQYRGLIALRNGLVLYGYPTIDINFYRERVRSEFIKKHLLFGEPFKINIAHSTFMRLITPQNGEKLIHFANTYNDIDLGSLTIKNLWLGNGSWKMLPQEVTEVHSFHLK